MEHSLNRCNEHFRRAVRRLPLGVSSNYRYWGESRTLYLSRAKGARLWDLDGNEYVDYRLGYGPAILGHAHPEVDAAAIAAVSIGGCTALSTEREFEVADRIAKMVPTAELVRFANSGSEVVNAALRLARAYTGKDAYVLIEGGFHGLFDAVLWRTERIEVDGETRSQVVPDGDGVPTPLSQFVHQVPANDCERLEEVFRRHGNELGAMLIEPILGNFCGVPCTKEYLETARKLCDRYEVVLILDEVKTGFRVARGGAQQLLGVRADLCTFAKAMGNGYPISALAGREEIMRKIDRESVAQGGTYAAHPVPLAAAAKTLQILDETDALQRVEAYGLRLRDALGGILKDRGIAHAFVGHPSMGGLVFAEEAPLDVEDWSRSDYDLYNDVAAELNRRGILCEPDSWEPWFVSAAHDEECLARTALHFEEALDKALEMRDRSAAVAVG